MYHPVSAKLKLLLPIHRRPYRKHTDTGRDRDLDLELPMRLPAAGRAAQHGRQLRVPTARAGWQHRHDSKRGLRARTFGG